MAAERRHRPAQLEADVAVEVPRDSGGSMAEGVESVLGRVDAVAAVENVDVRGLRPDLNRLRVTATVELRLADDVDPRDARDALADGVGVDVDRPAEPG